jgi:hypothetical protein
MIFMIAAKPACSSAGHHARFERGTASYGGVDANGNGSVVGNQFYNDLE